MDRAQVHEFTIDYTDCDTQAVSVPPPGDTTTFSAIPSDKFSFHLANTANLPDPQWQFVNDAYVLASRGTRAVD